MKLIKTPIDLKWVLLTMIAVIMLSWLIIAGMCAYNWRDFRYEKLQDDTRVLYRQADNLAKNLAIVNNALEGVTWIEQINGVLRTNGFPQYVRALPDTNQLKEK